MNSPLNTNIIDEHYLYPGAIFVSQEPYIVTTVLGSCVSVCLWDINLQVGGINHFMLPHWNGNGLASPKYGSIAIPKLFDKMIELGCNNKNIKAKVFGGGSVLNTQSPRLDIGKNNIQLAMSMLEELKIQIISSNLGGESGRKIRFNTSTGVVLLKMINKII